MVQMEKLDTAGQCSIFMCDNERDIAKLDEWRK